jgi:Histidine kinase-, DNA gyrase B-, and HSP90-like ATPase
MGERIYPVEVQTDFLAKITHAKPIQAVAEMIWNGLDADASEVSVIFGYNELDSLATIAIADNGKGFAHGDAPTLFGRLGGSWKRAGAITETGRLLHGQDGRGRFKAFALGGIAEWAVTYKGDRLRTFKIIINENNFREVHITDEDATDAQHSGVTVTIGNLQKEFRSLSSAASVEELTEIFALYLTDYKATSVLVDGNRLDPSSLIASRTTAELSALTVEDKTYPATVEIIEWKEGSSRSLHLCTEGGFPLLKVDRRFHIGSYRFSAYIKCAYISKLQQEGTLELAEMDPAVDALVNEAQSAIKDYFRSRAAEDAQTIVEEWKTEQIYPYEGEAQTNIQRVERQVFDIVAVNVAQFVPDFSSTPVKNRALHLRLLRQAIEKSPAELQVILDEVLKLPKRKQEELAHLLRDVSLSSIIGAAKVVADRLRFLSGLEAILFDSEPKERLKERSQLHRIIAQNCWLFGEEYSLSVDDQSLTEVLRKHRQLLGEDVFIDEPVKHISKTRGIVDLVLSRAIRRHRANDLHHLVVELKAPKVKIGKKEVGQIEEYAFSVMKDERFRSVNTTWEFWVIGDDFTDYATSRIIDEEGRIHQKENVEIFVKSWGQVIDENRARMQFFQERLEFQADKGASLKYLQEQYAAFLKGVFVETDVDTAES